MHTTTKRPLSVTATTWMEQKRHSVKMRGMVAVADDVQTVILFQRRGWATTEQKTFWSVKPTPRKVRQQHDQMLLMPLLLFLNPHCVREEIWSLVVVVVQQRAPSRTAHGNHWRRWCCRPAEKSPTFYTVWSSTRQRSQSSATRMDPCRLVCASKKGSGDECAFCKRCRSQDTHHHT
jgi:hypothetical protein